MHTRRLSLPLIALSAVLAACGSSVEPSTKTGSQCVDIPNGKFFQFVDGRLVSATLADVNAQEFPFETKLRLQNTLSAMGYPWVELEWDGETAVVLGLALDENTRLDAFIAAKSVLDTDPIAGPLVQRVINNMDVRDTTSAIAIRLTEELAADGFDWLSIVMAGNVATLVGTAPTLADKEAGYRAGRSTVESDRDAGEIVNIVVDAITSEGESEPVGTALVALTETASAGTCQDAFIEVMNGRNVQFESGESIVTNDSARLLDAATGVALLCEQHNIEIEGHTDTQGDVDFNLDLSQRRASAVRDYLMAYGVDPEALTARGYGASRPITGDGTDAERAENRRTVFVVRPRTN
ncbi:MAG: OmpA family protein [Pseudomonadota bacterium]